MRFPITLTPVLRPLFLIIGAAPSTCWVALEEDGIRLRFGWWEDAIPYAELTSIGAMRWALVPWGLGLRIGPAWTLGLVGSTRGVVRLGLRAPRRFRVPFALTLERVAASMEDPEGFTEALRSRCPGAVVEAAG